MYLNKLFLALLLTAGCILSSKLANAQIIPDSTIANPTKVEINDAMTSITGGTVAGTNLFHSFSQFNVSVNKTVLFNSSPDILNIFARVTNSNPSTISGTIKTLGATNLFLINPAGVIFTNGANLDIRGNFTASIIGLKFSNATSFGGNNQLLTISTPIGLDLTASNNNTIQMSGASLNSSANIQLAAGNVDINSSNINAKDINLDITNTPIRTRDNLLDKTFVDVSKRIVSRCHGNNRRQNSFTITGLGGLPQSPYQLLGSTIWNDLNARSTISTPQSHYIDHQANSSTELIEANQIIKQDEVFIRPDSNMKPFNAGAFNLKALNTIKALKSELNTNDTTLVLVSKKQPITKEWRFFVYKNQVITGSVYLVGEERINETIKGGYLENYVNQVLASVNWYPEALYTIDICETKGELHVLELGSYSCAGEYGCDLSLIIEAGAKAAIEEYTAST